MLTFNAYNADWYMWNKDKRRDYRMFLQFLHRPIELNVGVIYPLSLTTFTAVYYNVNYLKFKTFY